MIAHLFAVAVVATSAATPLPQASPSLKEIGHVRSNAFCTALRQNVAVTIVGLRADDKVIDKSKIAFAKMGKDAASNPATFEMDQVYLEYLVGALAHNLKLVDRLLGDEKRFPAAAKTDDETKLNDIKQRLLAVADKQRAALNVMNGLLATQQMGELQHERDKSMEGAVSDPGSAKPVVATTNPEHLFDAGLSSATPPGWDDPKLLADPLAVGGGSYAPFVRAILANQADTLPSEIDVTGALADAVQSCGGGAK